MSNQRRQPDQDRSRDRVATILEAARLLIVEEGHGRFKMSDVARRAGVSLPSIYRYFPNKTAILRSLAEEGFASSYQRVLAVILRTASGSSLTQVTAKALRSFFDEYRNNPIKRFLQAAVQADPELEHLDLESLRRMADIIKPVVASYFPNLDADFTVTELAMLITYFAGSLARLSSMVEDDESARLEAAYIAVVQQLLLTGDTLATAASSLDE